MKRNYVVFTLVIVALLVSVMGSTWLLGKFKTVPPAVESPSLVQQPAQFMTVAEKQNLSQQVQELSHPNSYLNQEEIAAIQKKIESNLEPWASAYRVMLQEADQVLNSSPPGLTRHSSQAKDPLNTGILYYSESPYCGWTQVDGRKPDCRDGQISPAADRSNYNQAIQMGQAMTYLGLAYSLTHQEKYAEKALELLHHWTIAPVSFMTPTVTHKSRIELSLTMPGIFYGADLIYDYPGWDVENKALFKSWARKLAQSEMSWSRHNNFENWKINLVAVIGAFLRDEEMLAYAFGRFKELIPYQINQQGEMVYELRRTKSLSYSLFALNGMMQTAEIARHFKLDLYDYQLEDGRGLKLAMDYHVPYILGNKSWPYKQIAALKHWDNVAIYELAYSHWQDPNYLTVIELWGRPMRESRVLKPITLTHGNLFQLMTMVKESNENTEKFY